MRAGTRRGSRVAALPGPAKLDGCTLDWVRARGRARLGPSTMLPDHLLDPYDPDSWRRALEGLAAARCSLAPVWPQERLLQGDPRDLLLLRADSLARAAADSGAVLWIEVGADPHALALLRAHGVSLAQAPDANLLAPWNGGNVPGVRSVQRLSVPNGRDATWLLDAYLTWLGDLPGVRVRKGPSEVRFEAAGVALLRFGPAQESEGRAWLPLLGGRLSVNHPGDPGRLELRHLPGGHGAMIAVHDYKPRLPRALYRATQAQIHLHAVEGFARSLEGQPGG